MQATTFSLLVATALLGAPQTGLAQLRHIQISLGGAPGLARAINNRGQVVGDSWTVSGERHAYLWNNGRITDLGTLPGELSGGSQANAINDSGHVVGYSAPSSAPRSEGRAFLWHNGIMTDLGTLGGEPSTAVAINNRGQIIGSSGTSLGVRHAFLWTHGEMLDLGALGGSWNSSVPVAINETGQIIGYSGPPSLEHAFLWQDGIMTDLGTLGGVSSSPRAINNSGQIVGRSFTGSGEIHAFLWHNGTMIDLGALSSVFRQSSATDINEKGQVVGSCSDASGNEGSRAVLWEKGQIIDLGSLDGLGNRSYASSINERGQIAGNSRFHTCIWDGGTLIDLGAAGMSGVAQINQRGQVLCGEGIWTK